MTPFQVDTSCKNRFACRVNMVDDSHLRGLDQFPDVQTCSLEGRESQTILSDLDGTLLRSRSAFPYYMLVAFEAGGPLRSIMLLLASPLIWILYQFLSESWATRVLIFLSCAGVKAEAIESVSLSVLPKFYLEDLHSESYRVFMAFGKRCAVTATPRLMAEPFLREYLGVEAVLGTELEISRGGYATGFVAGRGPVLGAEKARAVRKYFVDALPDVALGHQTGDLPFMTLCRESYLVSSSKPAPPVPRTDYAKPLIFHDGRLVPRPTPLMSLMLLLWAPIGFPLAVLRMIIATSTPMWFAAPASALLGVSVRVKGTPSVPHRRGGTLFVCTHRTLLDPIILSIVVGRKLTALTYSVSRLSEALSPIQTVRLTRCRLTDANTIRSLLSQGDLALCPEGTTCREPYLLRFSSLFAELTDQIVPVAMNTRITLFHGTTARGWKGLDAFFFFMNPRPQYEVGFLEQLPVERTCGSGRSSHEVANDVQAALGAWLGFQCTQLTRRDKYRLLVGHDGCVAGPESGTYPG